MLSETGRIIFYDQTFAGSALPGGEDVSEETRLRAAVTGVYELNFRQQPHYEFSGAFLDANTPADERQKQFEVSEDITDVDRILTLQSTADVIKLDSLEIIPLDWREHPLEFAPLETSEKQRKISYRKDTPPESLKLRLSGVNVFDSEIISAVMWANGRDYSPGKLATFIRRSEDIRIDRLENPSGEPRRLEEHLLTLFRLLLEKAPDRLFDFECSYRYHPVAGGAPAFVPVLFQRSLTLATARALFSDLLPALKNWYQNVPSIDGVFDFGVKVYGAGARESVPIMHLTGFVLPTESIAVWSDAGSK
jgi:hypothetical protein